MPLTTYTAPTRRCRDLSPLKGMPLTYLDCDDTQVSDLSPLKGMPLTHLDCGCTKVSDLSPLKRDAPDDPALRLHEGVRPVAAEGMPLTTWTVTPRRGRPVAAERDAADVPVLSSTSVSDLSPLKGMPLTYLDCNATPVSDLSPLEGYEIDGPALRRHEGGRPVTLERDAPQRTPLRLQTRA